MYKLLLKRFFDLFFGLLFLFLVSPIFLFSIILIRIESHGPAFYIQHRLGKNYKIFKLYKLRSMSHRQRSVHFQTVPSDPEITFVGHIIRRLKIDELPQLINVIKGDMSFVGPRPCLPDLAEQFDDNGKYRINVRPGLTGLAQINGNIYLTWPERWVFDRMYVENLNFRLDLEILIRTFAVVLLGERFFLKK